MTLETIYKTELFKYAICTRLLVLFLGFVSNQLIPDHNADAFVAPLDPEAPNSITYEVTNYIFGGFLRWDAQYFQHIARHGYTYENSLAFFPLFPMICRGIGLVVNYIYPTNLDAIITLIYILLNNLFFIYPLMALYDLTRLTFNNRFAYIAGCLFIINPATIFFVAPYTETLYAYLTFKAIYHSALATRKSYNCIMAIFFISLSALTRSNGLINIGFLAFFLIQSIFNMFLKSNILKIVQRFMVFAILCAICFSIPVLFFVLIQYYHYYNFCEDFTNVLPNYVELFGREHNLTMPGEHSKHNQTWCYYIIPNSYGFVQDKYWNVGFMRYFEWKQIPNFLLASPVIFILLRNSIPYLIKGCRNNILNFGIFKLNKSAEYKGIKCRNDIMFVCFTHATFLTLFCLFFVHIQVSTRMLLSANPSFYWICAYSFREFRIDRQRPISLHWKNITLTQLLLLTYCIAYIIAGTILFCNFLPWT